MDGIIQESGELQRGAIVSAEEQELLGNVVQTLEHALSGLESLQLTLAIALLDHAIAEAKRHLSS